VRRVSNPAFIGKTLYFSDKSQFNLPTVRRRNFWKRSFHSNQVWGPRMTDHLEQDIIAIVAEILEIQPASLSDESKLNEMLTQIDSVAMLEILVTLERKYQITVKETEIKTITNWRQLVELIRQKNSEK
jgi:acyl carrier protein